MVNLELLLINDLNNDGARGFRYQAELLNPNAAGTTHKSDRMGVADTTHGLALFDNQFTFTQGSDTSGQLVANNSADGLIITLDSNFNFPTDSAPVFAQPTFEWTITTAVPAGENVISGYEVYSRQNDPEGTVVKHSFDIHGIHTDDQELNPAALIQAELATGVDLNGNGTTAVSTSKITTEAVGGLRRALYQTNSGLLVSTMDGLAGQANPFKPTLAAANTNENPNTLLVSSGDASWEIPGGDASIIKGVVRRSEPVVNHHCRPAR